MCRVADVGMPTALANRTDNHLRPRKLMVHVLKKLSTNFSIYNIMLDWQDHSPRAKSTCAMASVDGYVPENCTPRSFHAGYAHPLEKSQ